MSIDTAITLEWPRQSYFDRCLSACTSKIGAAFGRSLKKPARFTFEELHARKKSLTGRVEVLLDRNSCYVGSIDARKARGGDLSRIFENQKNSLSPLANEDSVIIPALYQARSTEHQYLVIRSTTLSEIETQARRLGVRHLHLCSEEVECRQFVSPLFFKQARAELKLRFIAWIAIIGSIGCLLSAAGTYQNKRLEAFSKTENALRQNLLQRTKQTEEITLLSRVSDLAPETLTATGRLTLLADLTNATPRQTYWTSIAMHAKKIEIEGLSHDTAGLLTTMNTAFPSYDVVFSEAQSKNADMQKFSISLKRKNPDDE